MTPPRPSVRLAGVFAHPDDDSWTIGGTLLLHPGIELTLIFATSGEAGPITHPSLATRETLGGVREREQSSFLRSIGYEDARVEWFRHRDYYLPEVSLDELSAQIEAVLEDARPDVVVTFGPDGLTSHHDHVHVGAAATRAFHSARARGDGAFHRLYYTCFARSDVDRFYEEVRSKGFEYGEEGNLFDITAVPDDTIAVRVDTTRVREEKLAGILEHRTQQVENERVPESLRWIFLDTECFVQAYPSGDPIAAPRRDLFEDLDLVETS